MKPLTRAETGELLSCTAEELDRLGAYLDLLAKWNPKINLVGATTLTDPWRRHILDSGQIRAHLPADHTRLVDFGSGAGLPGLILAILGARDVHLIESDRRKC